MKLHFKSVLMCLVMTVARLSVAQPTPDSIYQFDGAWQTQDGKKFRLQELQGQQVALAFFYSTCKAVCPLIVNTMTSMQKKLSGTTSTPAQFVLVSLDPETDTVATLKAFAAAHNLPSESWHLLHGTEDQVRTLSVLMQAKYAPTADGEFTHSNFIAVLDASGKVVGAAPGVPANAPTLAALFSPK